MKALTEERFLLDVAEHKVSVLLDSGLHRHIQFRKPGTSCMGFDLVTWPGYLCFSGDMGSFVFSRLPDMFEFFRQPPITEGAKLRINPQYWSEKCQAEDRSDGMERYSATKFREAIARYLEGDEADASLREAVASDVLSHADDGEYEARRAVSEFTHEGKNPFQDFWEAGLHDYTHRFIWCCYALVWGIQQYDKGLTTDGSVQLAPQSRTTR